VKTSGVENVERVLQPSGTGRCRMVIKNTDLWKGCAGWACVVSCVVSRYLQVSTRWMMDFLQTRGCEGRGSAETDIERLTLTSRNLASQKCRFQRFLVV
jgi:hypothetical protein